MADEKKDVATDSNDSKDAKVAETPSKPRLKILDSIGEYKHIQTEFGPKWINADGDSCSDPREPVETKESVKEKPKD